MNLNGGTHFSNRLLSNSSIKSAIKMKIISKFGKYYGLNLFIYWMKNKIFIFRIQENLGFKLIYNSAKLISGWGERYYDKPYGQKGHICAWNTEKEKWKIRYIDLTGSKNVNFGQMPVG